MSAIKFIQGVARKSLTKNQGSGITTIPGAMQSEAKAAEIVALLQRAGIPMNQLDDFIRSEADVLKFLNIIEAASKPKVYSGQAAVDQLNKLFPKKGEVVEFPQKTSFKEQVEAMKKSGDIVDPNNLKKNDKVLQRELFNNSSLNKTDTVTDTITYIKTLEPIKAMKEANSIIARKGKYKDLTPEQSKKILQDTEDHIFQRDPDNLYDYDPEDMAKGGRAGFYTGGITDVEPSLDDIGHGADALMSRTRLMSPGAQATTSTGLNYLLAEDNDNMRVPFAGGGPTRQGFKMGKRAFLKLLGSGFAGIAGLKSGLLGFGKKDATKQVVKELTSVPIGNPEGMPVWFKPLVNKIIKEGDDVTKKFGTVDREIVHTKKIDKFEEVTVYQDLNTGNVRLEYGPHLTDDTGKVIRASNEPTVVQLEYKAPEVLEPNLTTGKSGGKTKEEFYAAESEPEIVNWEGDIEMSGINEVNKVDDLITDTSKLQKYATDNKLTIKELSDSMKKQKYKNKLDSDPMEQVNYIENKSGMNAMDYIDEGTRVGDFDPKGYLNYDTKGMNLYDGVKKIKKADGGRIGFSAGNLAKLGINSTSRRFLEKVFGKEGFETMIENDPRMHRGMLEVVEMFRNRDKEGLKMYLQKFMPNMDDTEIEKFIIGDSGTEGIEGQLIRLGSGREYENLIDLKKQADNVRKLEDFNIDGVSKNAEGGRIGFSGGGIIRAIIAKSAAKKGMSVTDFIKATNYKGLPPEVRMYISPEDFAALKGGQKEMYDNYIDMAKTRLNFQKHVEGGKNTPARELFEGMEKTMDEQSFVPKTVTNKDIAEMELMVKNRFNKGRKDNAQGGLQTMLGE